MTRPCCGSFHRALWRTYDRSCFTCIFLFRLWDLPCPTLLQDQAFNSNHARKEGCPPRYRTLGQPVKISHKSDTRGQLQVKGLYQCQTMGLNQLTCQGSSALVTLTSRKVTNGSAVHLLTDGNICTHLPAVLIFRQHVVLPLTGWLVQ